TGPSVTYFTNYVGSVQPWAAILIQPLAQPPIGRGVGLAPGRESLIPTSTGQPLGLGSRLALPSRRPWRRLWRSHHNERSISAVRPAEPPRRFALLNRSGRVGDARRGRSTTFRSRGRCAKGRAGSPRVTRQMTRNR